ncbi:MAG: ATP-binding protein [Gammaproteobacteria bacterium]|nr:ATP-binding protein [Gammaproteobacteria bacterium]
MLDHTPDDLRVIADAIPYPVIYIEATGAVGFTNRAFRQATRLQAAPVDGKPVESVLSAQENDNGRAAFMECLTEGHRVTREGPTAVPGAPVRYCKYVYEPVRNADGRVLGVCVTVVDLTDIKNAEEALRTSNDELERSNRDLEQFAYVASHDLKAPLRSIEVLVGWLTEDLAGYDQGDVQENLGLLKTRSARLNRLLDDLLTYSRAGRRVGDVSEVDVAELVEEIWTLMGPPEDFKLSIEGEMPTVTTFRAPLEQVFRNLMGNAIKHHPGPAARITVGAEYHDDHVVFSVSDDGSGIADEYRERIYQMFQTLQPRDEVEGSGMGLAIVSRLVEWQGGRIWHEQPVSGTGTVFKFEWKAVNQAAAERLMKPRGEAGSEAA